MKLQSSWIFHIYITMLRLILRKSINIEVRKEQQN